MSDRVHKYIVVCSPGFGSKNLIGTQARGGEEVSEHARIYRTEQSAEALLKAVRTGLANVDTIFVARIDGFGEDIATHGVGTDKVTRTGRTLPSLRDAD